MRLLVFGSREWADEDFVRHVLRRLGPGHELIHGAARGADTIAARVAAELGWNVRAFPARWNEEGRAAGVLRNQRMLDEGRPDGPRAHCFHDDLYGSRGSSDMARRCLHAGLNVRYHQHDIVGGWFSYDLDDQDALALYRWPSRARA